MTRGQKIYCFLYVVAWFYITAVHVANAKDKPDDTPAVHVVIVWTDDKGDIEYTEHAGIAQSAKRCGEMTIKDVQPHVPDFKNNLHKWTPHILCAISQEHYVAPKEGAPKEEVNPEEEPDDPENSRPGTGGNQPSLPL